MKPAHSYPLTISHRDDPFAENPLPDDRNPKDLERERIRQRVSLIHDAQELGRSLTEVWD